MPRGGQNRLPVRVKQSYFELIRMGMPGAEAARRVGVSMSCGSLWFIDAGSVSITETRPISSRYINQDDRIEIADGLAAGEPVKSIAARIGKSFQSLYREIARNRKADGTYQPWFAHNQAHLRRRRPRRRILAQETSLAAIIAGKLAKRWSPEQISRWLRRRYRRRLAWHVCAETIYDAIYRQLVVVVCAATLRTGRTYRHKRGRGRTKDGALKQSTAMKSIHDRPAAVETRRPAGHWEELDHWRWAALGDRDTGRTQDPSDQVGAASRQPFGAVRRRCADCRILPAPSIFAPNADLGSGQ